MKQMENNTIMHNNRKSLSLRIYIAMKYLLLPLLFLMSCSSCKKEAPEGPATLIGTWLSADSTTQFGIKELKDNGRTYGFTEVKKDGNRYLKVRYEKETSLYLVKWVTKYQMLLQDSAKNDIQFQKIAD